MTIPPVATWLYPLICQLIVAQYGNLPGHMGSSIRPPGTSELTHSVIFIWSVRTCVTSLTACENIIQTSWLEEVKVRSESVISVVGH